MVKLMLTFCIMFFSIGIYAQTKYTEQEILNKVYLDANGNSPYFNTEYSAQNVFNAIYNDTNALRIYVSTVNVPFVLKAGDSMTGPLMTTSTMTIQGNAFSVGTSTLVVKSGNVGIGTVTPNTKLDVTSTVRVSSSTTSTDFMCMAGSFVDLPISGYNRGCFAYQTSNDTMYVSTEIVVGSYSWKPVW